MIWYGIGGAFLALGLFAGVQTVRLSNANEAYAEHLKADAEAALAAEQAARKVEQDHAKALAAVAEQYEQDKRDAQRKAESVAADLRSGALRLRREWAGCETGRLSADAATAARESDADARVREQSAAALIGLGAQCDAHVKGLQEVIRKDRE